jgi:uncharacterized protein (TIGR00251 family)
MAATPDGVRLRLRVQPRASRNEVVGLSGDQIRVRIAAPPVDGAANDTLVRFLADRLGVPRSSLVMTAGTGSRSKVVLVEGVTPDQVARRLGLSRPGGSAGGHRPRA